MSKFNPKNAIGSNERAQMDLNAETTRTDLDQISRAKSLGKAPQTLIKIELIANRYIAGVNAINELPNKAPNKQRAKLNEIFHEYRQALAQLKIETGYDLSNEETWESDTP
jgi:hypothetical protein